MLDETEWLGCADPRDMIDFLGDHFTPTYQRAHEIEEAGGDDADLNPAVKAIARKLRLFAVGCCRHVEHLLSDRRSLRALEWIERYVDGLAPEEERLAVARMAGAVSYENEERYAEEDAASAVYRAVDDIQDEFTDAQDVAKLAVSAVAAAADGETEWSDELRRLAEQAERTSQADLLREVFGNPFRRVHVSPEILSWNDGTVRRIAAALYAEGAFEPLPILADALEESGCTDVAVLEHCRRIGGHVRGCWLIDLLLQKE